MQYTRSEHLNGALTLHVKHYIINSYMIYVIYVYLVSIIFHFLSFVLLHVSLTSFEFLHLS